VNDTISSFISVTKLEEKENPAFNDEENSIPNEVSSKTDVLLSFGYLDQLN
jgi:hypothetical protein